MECKWPRQYKGDCSCAEDAGCGRGDGELLARGWLEVNEGESESGQMKCSSLSLRGVFPSIISTESHKRSTY